MTTRTIGTTLACLALATATASAQLPQASAAALGMGYNMTASARGFAAVANNPAGLAHASSPGFSLAIPAVSVEAGLGPITLQDLVDWEGQLIPSGQKDAWLQSIAASGGQGGSLGAGATPLALSVGPVGFQLSTLAGAQVSLAPDAAELLLYGNAGRTGTPQDFDLRDSELDGYVLSTAALSVGFHVSERVSLGVTGKYTMGNALVVGRDAGSFAISSPLSVELDFPVLLPSDDWEYDNGTGLGLDVGALWEGPAITVGASVQNVFNTFEWKLDGFSYVAGQAFFDQDTTDSNFEEQPASAAPAAFREIVESRTLEPVFAVGLEMRPLPILRLQADIRKRAGGGLALGPEAHMGIGAELTALPVLPLRAHLAVVTGGVQVGGGASLVLGPLNLTGAVALRTGEIESATLGMFTLSFGGN